MNSMKRQATSDSDTYSNYYNYYGNYQTGNYYNDTMTYYQYSYNTQTIQYPQDQYPYYYYYYEDKALTGINYLDAYILSGGFKRGEVYLIAGEAGTGKTIFSLTFLRTGAELGEVVCT